MALLVMVSESLGHLDTFILLLDILTWGDSLKNLVQVQRYKAKTSYYEIV